MTSKSNQVHLYLFRTDELLFGGSFRSMCGRQTRGMRLALLAADATCRHCLAIDEAINKAQEALLKDPKGHDPETKHTCEVYAKVIREHYQGPERDRLIIDRHIEQFQYKR